MQSLPDPLLRAQAQAGRAAHPGPGGSLDVVAPPPSQLYPPGGGAQGPFVCRRTGAAHEPAACHIKAAQRQRLALASRPTRGNLPGPQVEVAAGLLSVAQEAHPTV